MKTAIMMSCKRAIKANHHLDEREAKALLKRLPQCENPFNCPHGRPVTVHFNDQDLEKMFKRIRHHTPRMRMILMTMNFKEELPCTNT